MLETRQYKFLAKGTPMKITRRQTVPILALTAWSASPANGTHLIDKDAAQIKELEHVREPKKSSNFPGHALNDDRNLRPLQQDLDSAASG